MATRYWVGGNGTWNSTNTTNWSTTSGGAGGASAPVAADTVIFDANSGTGTCTTEATATATTATLNSANLVLSLGTNLTLSGAFTLTSGVLSLTGNSGNWNLTCLSFASSGVGTRSIDFGTGTITLTGNNATIWNTSTSSGFTYIGTPKIISNYSGAVGTRTIVAGTSSGGTETNTPSFYITAGTDIVSITHALTIDLTGFAGTFLNIARNLYGDLVIPSGVTVSAGTNQTIFRSSATTQNIDVNTSLTLDFPIRFGVSGTATYRLLKNLTLGSSRTAELFIGNLDLNNSTLSTGLFASNNSNTRSITFGTGNITVTGNGGTVLQVSTATGLTYTGTPTINFTYSGSTGTRNLRFGNGGGFTETNSPSINITAGTDIVSFEGGAKNFIFSGFAGTFSNNPRTIYGNFTLTSGITLTAGTSVTTFAGTSGTQQLTIAGLTLDFPLTFNGIGGTFAFQDALTQGSTRAFTITNGTVQLKNGVTSTVGAFATSGTNQKFLQSTLLGSQATLSQASGTVNASYLTIRDINATGGATWNAFTTDNNVNAGNNLGWDFSSQLGKYIYTRRKNKRILP
jgi:hypothetical protein